MLGQTAGLRETVRMHEHDHAEIFAAGEDLAKPLGRQILASDMRHYLDTPKAGRFVQSLQFRDCKLRGLKRYCPQADETVGMAAADVGDEIVDCARRFETKIGVGSIIGLARRWRDRLNVDPHPV